MPTVEVGISKPKACQSDGYKIDGCFALYYFNCESQAQRPWLGLCESDVVEKRPPPDQEETDLDSRINS